MRNISPAAIASTEAGKWWTRWRTENARRWRWRSVWRRGMADLTTVFAGRIRCPNPFWLASGPPTNCGEQVMRAFDAGWRGVEDDRRADRQRLVALLQRGLERPANDGPEQYRADHRPADRNQSARDRGSQEALPEARRDRVANGGIET